MNKYTYILRISVVGLCVGLTVSLAGCPPLGETSWDREYAAGFLAGFADDESYWEGYFDSYETVPDGPLLYSGSTIPHVTSPPYDAGYWDGVWQAYNDGYFVCYDYAFTIGFSEGYDLAYYPDWYYFLSGDVHLEYLDGSFTDGYNDGFSEGRIFGAVDYRIGLPFDWLDAMWDYRAGTDLYIEELDLGTGEYGPVYLYEYGVDPAVFYEKSLPPSGTSLIRRPRGATSQSGALSPRAAFVASVTTLEKSSDTSPEISYRDLTARARADLSVSPTYSTRESDRALNLKDRWLDRVNAYRESRE